jgi:hypothetical protein
VHLVDISFSSRMPEIDVFVHDSKLPPSRPLPRTHGHLKLRHQYVHSDESKQPSSSSRRTTSHQSIVAVPSEPAMVFVFPMRSRDSTPWYVLDTLVLFDL